MPRQIAIVLFVVRTPARVYLAAERERERGPLPGIASEDAR